VSTCDQQRLCDLQIIFKVTPQMLANVLVYSQVIPFYNYVLTPTRLHAHCSSTVIPLAALFSGNIKFCSVFRMSTYIGLFLVVGLVQFQRYLFNKAALGITCRSSFKYSWTSEFSLTIRMNSFASHTGWWNLPLPALTAAQLPPHFQSRPPQRKKKIGDY
jgi:hypothetical protein